MALGIGSLICFASMVMASQVGETAAMRLHATELLLLLGTAIVLLVERPAQPKAVVEQRPIPSASPAPGQSLGLPSRRDWRRARRNRSPAAG